MPPLSRGLCRLSFEPTPTASRLSYARRNFGSRNDFFKVSEEVQDALQNSKPVVALETTIYTHGFPYPENVALSSHLESLVRVNGGIPATIGVLNGIARVGMQAEELIELVSSAGRPDTMKISRRDLGYISGLVMFSGSIGTTLAYATQGLTGRKLNGGTTISGTMILAHLAGVRVFATGGLGGVHRGAENSLDISADLTELGRTPVAVISAGCKSFLDLPRTLEYLETQGVGVATFADGRVGPVDLPAFYVRDSGIKSPRTIKDEAEAAAIIYAQSRFPVHSGLWFAGPVPAKDSLAKDEVEEWAKIAIDEAESKGIYGAANTPYILDKIMELSAGRSVIANRAAIAANVIRGTKVAVELAKLDLRDKGILERRATTITKDSAPSQISGQKASLDSDIPSTGLNPLSSSPRCEVLVAGALAADLSCDYAPLGDFTDSTTPLPLTSNPAVFSQSVGGVGHNVALASYYAGASTLLCSAVGNDITGQALIEQVKQSGLPTSGIEILDPAAGARTAQYVAINDTEKNLVMAMADMSILSSPSLQSASFWQSLLTQHRPEWVIVDCNWPSSIISEITAAATSGGARIAVEPVSAQKSSRLIKLLKSKSVVPNHLFNIATPNILELQTMYHTARDTLLLESESWWQVINALNLPRGGSRDRFIQMTNAELVDQGVPQQSLQLLPYIPCMLVKLGAQGCLLSQLLRSGDPRLWDPESAPYILGRAMDDQTGIGGVYMRLFPPAEFVKQEQIVSVNGVGDTMLGVLIAGLTKRGANARIEDVVMAAQKAAVMTLKSEHAVSEQVKGVAAALRE